MLLKLVKSGAPSFLPSQCLFISMVVHPNVCPFFRVTVSHTTPNHLISRSGFRSLSSRSAKMNTTKSVLSFYRILSVINIYFLRFTCLVSVYKPIQAKPFTSGYNRLLILFSLPLFCKSNYKRRLNHRS